MSGVLTVDKVPVVARARFSLENVVSFPAGGLDNQKPIINLLMQNYQVTERIDTYFDIGATDADKDLDVVDSNTLKTLYVDPSFGDAGFETSGVLSPKAVLMRCLAGSGFVYLNAHPSLAGVEQKKQAPLALHANVGVFYYAFPKAMPHYSKMVNPSDPTDIRTTSISLMTIHLRTFEEANRFQLVIFK